MKLRIKGNSLRVRVAQGELRQLAESGQIADEVAFAPGQSLTYRLVSSREFAEISAMYTENCIQIRIPVNTVREWAGTEQVTLSREQPAGAQTLRIVLEKDFACLAPREGEDESDHFPHPASGTGQTC